MPPPSPFTFVQQPLYFEGGKVAAPNAWGCSLSAIVRGAQQWTRVRGRAGRPKLRVLAEKVACRTHHPEVVRKVETFSGQGEEGEEGGCQVDPQPSWLEASSKCQSTGDEHPTSRR